MKLSHVYNYTLNNEQINTAAEVDYKNVNFKIRRTCKVASYSKHHTQKRIPSYFTVCIYG